MSNKLIDLSGLSEFKDYSDLKYQDKLTAGDSITLNNNVLSLTPTLGTYNMENTSVESGSITEVGSITLAPGYYILAFACPFSAVVSANSHRKIGFSVNNTDLDGFGASWVDCRADSNTIVQTLVSGTFQISATDYPNGRTFYFLVYQDSGISLTVKPRCNYLKF